MWASYKDGFVTDDDDPADGDDGDSASKASEHVSVARPNANARPRFLDKGPLERSVAENEKGASVGDPVAAIDSDPMIYTLSGDDAGAFKIDTSGQITTAEKLDYETKSSYMVTVTATDPSLASASITVDITVTDADDPATITLLAGNGSVEYAENGTGPVASLSASDQDGDETAFSLSGPDAGKFAISEDGELSFKSSPNLRVRG